MAEKFYPDLYVTCASVIPVLFLAIAVQGTYFASMMEADNQFRLMAPVLAMMGPNARTRLTAMTSVALVLQTLGLLILAAAGVGEFFALLALYYRSVLGSWQPVLVFWTTVGLMFVVVAAPMVNAVWANIQTAVRQSRESGDSAAQGGQAPEVTGGDGGSPGAS